MIFQHNLQHLLQTFRGEYCAHLNSEDLYSPEIALDSPRPKGGTMAMWTFDLDPFITIHPTHSSSILAVILNIPNTQTSIHIGIYLPTSGKDSEFLHELSNLEVSLEELHGLYPATPIFIRGDRNCNKNHNTRSALINHFIRNHSLSKLALIHDTSIISLEMVRPIVNST